MLGGRGLGIILIPSLVYAVGFKLGVENLPKNLLKNKRVAIFTNQTGCDQLGRKTVDLLLGRGVGVELIFAPEHGFDGKVKAGSEFGNSIYKNIPVISWYGSRVPSRDDFDKIDVIVFDLQDSGMRHYTYISSLYYTLKKAKELGKMVIVLDRPNPLGYYMEGPLVEPGLESYISIAPIPLRHGMTIGEIALYFNKVFFSNKVSLNIVPMMQYKRTSVMKKLKAPLSPNISNIQACRGYSFLGLLGDIKPFNVGIGTKMAFRCILLPKQYKVNWSELQNILTRHGVRSRHYDEGQYKGLSIIIDNINGFSGFNTLMDAISFFKRSKVPMEFKPTFDKAVGTSAVSHGIKRSILSVKIKSDLKEFFQGAKECFLYKPYPKIINLS